MSNDQIKKVLLTLRKSAHDFTVILSGKKSRKVHGLYKPDTREIIIHNKNFTNDNELMYTAIHEYAHHLHCERKGGLSSGKGETTTPTPAASRFNGCVLAAPKKSSKRLSSIRPSKAPNEGSLLCLSGFTIR